MYDELEYGIKQTWGSTDQAGFVYLRCSQLGGGGAELVGNTLYADTKESPDNLLLKMQIAMPRIWEIYGGLFDYMVRPCSGSYFVLDRLKAVLQDKPREGLCFGVKGECQRTGVTFLSGAGYVLSSDVVKRLALGDVPYHPTIRYDDVSLGYALAEMGYELDGDGAMRTDCDQGRPWSVDDGSYHYHFRTEAHLMYDVHEKLGAL